jgi:HAD superfamily hydrolase (TIGR01484 family)
VTETKRRAIQLLASDLDGTLIPPPHVQRPDDGIEAFSSYVAERSIRLAYVTGRHLGLALEGIEAWGLPLPEAIAADVGTSVHWCRAGRFELDPSYREVVAATPGVIPASDIQALLDGIGGLTLQEASKQGDFKVSYYVDPPRMPDITAQVRERLASAGSAHLVTSHDALEPRGLLDVLPDGIGKRTAVEYLRDRLGLPETTVVYAGDSGNDLDALLSPLPGILVANASEAVRAELRRRASDHAVPERLFTASRPWAVGVVEGLRHFSGSDALTRS